MGRLATILEKAGLLPPEEITAAVAQAEQQKRPLGQIVLNDKKVSEEKLAEALARHTRAPYVRLAAMTVDPDVMRLVSEEVARRFFCFPVKKEGRSKTGEERSLKRRPTLVLAMTDPTDLLAVQDVEFASGCAVTPVVATRTDIKDAIERYYAPGWRISSAMSPRTGSFRFLVPRKGKGKGSRRSKLTGWRPW